MEHFLQSWGYLALFALTVGEASCIPIPSEVTLGFGGALAGGALGVGHGQLNIVVVIALATLGETTGAYIGWLIGRVGGRAVVERWGRYLLLTRADLDRSEAWFARRGEPTVLIGRVLPVLRTFISIPAGMAEMNPVRFGLFTAIGSLVWCSVLAGIGFALGVHWHEIVKGFSLAGYAAVALALVAVAVFIVHRLQAVRSEQAQAQLP